MADGARRRQSGSSTVWITPEKGAEEEATKAEALRTRSAARTSSSNQQYLIVSGTVYIPSRLQEPIV